MVSARIPKKLRVAPFAKIDDTLAGVARRHHHGARLHLHRRCVRCGGGEVAIEKMTTSTRKAKIKKGNEGHRPDR